MRTVQPAGARCRNVDNSHGAAGQRCPRILEIGQVELIQSPAVGRRMLTFACLVIGSIALSVPATDVRAQGGVGIGDAAGYYSGHCPVVDHLSPVLSKPIFSCWNFQAGDKIADRPYPEFLPNLRGWDFRINLPHVRFLPLRNGRGSPVTMVGVIEDPVRMDLPTKVPTTPRKPEYGHRSNAIWMFREEGGKILFSQMPSRRVTDSTMVVNTSRLDNAWNGVGGGADAGGFRTHRIAAAVLGRGTGKSTVHIVAVDLSNRLWHNQMPVSQGSVTSWPGAWQSLGAASLASPVVAAIDNSLSIAPDDPADPNKSKNSLALAWVDPGKNLRLRLFDLQAGTWGAPLVVATGVDGYTPRLIWDGRALHVLYVAGDRLWHTFKMTASGSEFSPPKAVSSLLPVFQGQFDATYFNNAIHIAVRTQTGNPVGSGVFYATTKSRPPQASAWTTPSDTGLKASDAPRIASLEDNLFVIAGNLSGRVAYARKDPNAVDNRISGGANADRWLQPGLDIDAGAPGWLAYPEVLSFNGDLYLTALRDPFQPVGGGAQIINFGRAAMKKLITDKWGMTLIHGSFPGGKPLLSGFGDASQVRMLGDFNGDNMTEPVRFTQKNISGVGNAPVYVGPAVWHASFSPKGEIPLVGNFDGDAQGRDDVVTFMQKRQNGMDGDIIGTAPVYVALSDGQKFGDSRLWHTFFSLKGEIPLVGDFNGDGKDDIVTFVQQPRRNAAGTVTEQAPVWVALSDGRKFGASRIWHNFFAPKGEIPMVGDFNGDGKDDIATFVQRPHKDAQGNVIAQAPVWVALSDGVRFGPSRIWHNFFAPVDELPRVVDTNMDGKDDIVTFVRDSVTGSRQRNVYTAYSTGSKFETSILYVSDMVSKTELPEFGVQQRLMLATFTNRPEDRQWIPDLYVFQPNGDVRVAAALGSIDYANGAPWERYKWFTEKGRGLAMFPEWIYATGPSHCISPSHRLALRGASGSGGAALTNLSVRIGSRAEHVLEEVGHSMSANCMRKDKDPFALYKLIYETPMSQGGLDANNRPGCDQSFDDCDRSPDQSPFEHFFLHLMKRYRLDGDNFRQIINSSSTPADVKLRRYRQYIWLKRHWYRGAEFKAARSADPSVTNTYGLLCLPGECQINAPAAPPIP